MTSHPGLHDVPLTADLLHGAVEVETTDRGLLPHRLPSRARAQNDDPQLAMSESQPSGVRLVLSTAATHLELDAVATKRVYTGLPPRPDGLYDLLVDGVLTAQRPVDGGRRLVIDMARGTSELVDGGPGTVAFTGLPEGPKRLEVWLPHGETTELVALRADAPVEAAAASGRRVWVHHGSSISHGSDAASPSTTWPALAAAASGVDLVNLGLGGAAMLDPFTARAMRDLPADVLSVKVGINIVNADLMRRRALGPAVHGFLDLLREGHPDAPLLVVSPLLCPVHEDTPGPLAPDLDALREGVARFVATGDPADVATGRLTLRTVRAELERVVTERAADDPHLAYLDGLRLYGPADHDVLPLPDALHPDAATHRLIGERFAALAFGLGGPLAAG